MDDVTNTMNTAAAAEPQQPAVRVRVVDATTRQTMNDISEVVFVPCADSEPIKIKNKALEQLPARRYLVKATAPGYQQLNYLEGPVNIYHDHLVVDQDGRPQKEVVIQMERRVACCWLSVSDGRDGRALPTASVQLLDEKGDVCHVFDAPGSHDVAAVTSVTKTYALRLHLKGYVLHGPTTVTLERGKRIDLLMTARRTDVKVVCRDLRSGRRIDDVDIQLINEENEVLEGDTVDTDVEYRIVARAEGFRQVTRIQKCTFPPKLFAGSTSPLEVRVDLEPVKSSIPLAPPRRAVWGWLALDQPSPSAPETETAQKKPKKKKTSEDWGTCTINVRAVDATHQKPVRLAGARVRVDGNVSGETDERGALQLKLRAPSSEPTSVTVQVEKDGFISDATSVKIQASQAAQANLALRRTLVRVDVVHASSGKPVTGDVDFELAPDDSRAPLPEVAEGDGLVLSIKHDRATFDGVVAQRHRDESQTYYDVVGVDGSDVTLLKVRRDDLAPTKDNLLQRELEIGENVACLYPHAGRYKLTCKAPGLRLSGPAVKTFSARDFTEKGPLQLTLRLEPSVARLRLACATEDGVPVSCLADVGGERLELSDDGSFSTVDVPLPRGKTQASVSLRVAAPQFIQVPPFEVSLGSHRATEVVAYVRPCDIRLTAVAKGNILKKATLQLIRVDANGDDDEIRVVEPGSRVAVDVGAEYRVQASARGHRQVGLLKTFIATPETFLKQPGPVSLAVDMAPDVGAIDLAVLDVVGRPVRHARVTVTYERLPSLYLGHRRGVQELPLDGSEELEVDVTCDEAGYVQVSPQRIKVKAGRLRKTSIILRRSDVVLRAVDARTGATLRALEDLRLELKPVEGDKTLSFSGAGGEVFGPAQAVDLRKAYRVCVDARRFKLVEPIHAVTFTRNDFGVLEDHKHLAPLLERARDAARRKARRSGVDADRAEEQLRLEIDARLAKVVDVRVEPLVGDLNVEVIDARSGLPVPDIALVLKTSNSEVDLGLQRGLVEDIPMSGGGAIVTASILVKSCDRVQLEPTRFDLRAGETTDIRVYVRDADVVIHCVDQETGDALIPDACYLEGGTTLDASDRCRVVVDRDYEVRCVVPRYRRLGSKRFRVTRDDFRTLTDVETPFQVVVSFEPCEADIDLRVEDAATGQLLSRAHVRIGPHSLGCTRGLESLRLPPSTRQVTWSVSAQQQGWVLVAPRDVELHATPQHDDDPRSITVLMRRCEVLIRCVDAMSREPLDAHCLLEPANDTTPQPWRLDDDDDACVVDVSDNDRTGTIRSVGDAYDVALDDGSEELRCAAEELKREDGTEPSSYLIEERVVVKRPHSYVVRASCDGHRQVTHLGEMTFALSDFAGLPVQAPLKLEVAMEAVAGVVDISVEDKRGAKIRSCEVWLDGVALGTQRGLIPINLPGGGKPHEARVDVSAPGYALVGPSRVTVFAGCTTPLKIRLVATRCLIRVEDARDGAPIECRVCLVRERPRPRFDALPSWIKIGDRVEARLQGDWVEGTLEGEDPYAVQFDDTTIHNFERCDLRPVSTYDHVLADPDLDPAFDGAGKNWCDWRSMSPLAIDCSPASYRVLIQDPQGEFRQVSHYEPVEFDVDELVKYKAAAREHGNDSLARKLLGKKKRRPEKKSGWFSWNSPKEDVKPPPREDVSDGDKHAKVALVVVQVAPRVAAADFRVVDQSGKALKADVAIGGTNLGTRRGRVELDWCAIAPDAFLPPACAWRHAAGARADGSGVPCAVVATLDGYVQTSEDVIPFSSTGVTSFKVEMRKSTLVCNCYDAATNQKLTDVAVDLVPLDGQVGVRWTAGSSQQQRVAVGRAYRVVARGGRLRQTTPAIDEDVIFGRADWAQLDGETPAELRVMLERRVATVEVRVVDASQQLLTHARCKVGATHFSQAEGWQQDVDLPCGRQAMREMPALCSLDDYLQLPPKRCDVFVGDANNVNLVELRMRPLSVCLRASSCYDDKVIEGVKWRLKPVSSDLPLVPLEARLEQVLRLGQKYVLECSVDGWRPCASNTEVEADSLLARFEGISASEPLPLDFKFEASSVPVRLNSIKVENGNDPDARTCVVEVAGKRVPYGAVVDIPLPVDVDASQGCSLEVTASLPDQSLTFLPYQIKCFPGSGEVTDVNCVFKALYLCVTVVDRMDHELGDASYRLNGGSQVKSGHRCSVHLGACTVACIAEGCRQTTFLEPLTLMEQDFISTNDGFERSIKVVCAPKMATVLVSVTDATTNEPLHRASIEMSHNDSIVWSSGGTPADRKGMRRAILDDVPGGGDDVEVACACTLEGYTQIQPLSCLIRAGSANDQPWTCELLMRKYYVSIDVVDSHGKRVPGAGVELRSSSDIVAYQPSDVKEQAPLPIQLDTSYHIYPIISSLKGAGGEYFLRDRWHAADASIVFSRSDFEVLERRARDSLKRSVMKSDDPRYPFLKRVCERPTWRALHAWIQGAGVKRQGFDVALPPLKLAVRACPGRALIDLRVVDATGAPLSNAAIRMKTGDEWINLKQGVQDVRVPGGGELRKVHFDALLQGHLLEKEHSCDLRATYDEDEPTLVLLKLFPLKLRIRVTDGDQPARDARITIMGGDGEETPLVNREGVCETSLPLDEALVITASTAVTRHVTLRYSADDIRRSWANEPGAPITCDLDLARANAHVKLTVTDLDGKVLENAEVDLGGQRLTTGTVIEVPPLTELKGCFLEGYVLDSPQIGWRVPTDEDEVALDIKMRPTQITVKLVDARSLNRIDTPADVTLTASDGTTISGRVGDALHVTCDVPYDIQVASSTDLKQVSHHQCTFTPEMTSLDIRVDVPSRLVVDVRDADTNAPLPDAILELNGTIVNRGAVDGFERCTSLDVKATLPTYLQLTPTKVALDPSRKTSLVVIMRACRVKVDVQDVADARIRVDDRQIDEWLVEPGREYALEVVAEGRDAYREKVRFGSALFVDGPFTHAVELHAASICVDVSVVDATGTPLNDAEVVLGDLEVGRDRGLTEVPLPSSRKIEVACRLPGFVLMKPRSLTIKRGETTTCRLAMRPSMVTHALEGASVELIGVDGVVALPGTVQVGQTYTLYSNTHNVEARSITFKEGDWDSLKNEEALELKVGVAASSEQEETSDLVSITVVDADGGELPNASVTLGSTMIGTKRVGRVGRGAVPVKVQCSGYALVGPRSYDGAAHLRITMRRARINTRALVDGAELTGARVLFDERERDGVEPDQSYAVTVALEDDEYRITGAAARWPGGSRSWNNAYVTMSLPHDAWTEKSEVQFDLNLVATTAELMVDVREAASGFPVSDSTFTVTIGDVETPFTDARGVLRVAVPSGRVDAVLECDASGCAAWSRKLSLRAGSRESVDVQLRRLEGDDASSYETRSLRPTTERTLDDVWAASRRCLAEAQSESRPAQIRADLDRYVLLRPKTVDLSYSNTVQPLTVCMRRCNLRGRCYDVRDGSLVDAPVEIEARDPERGPASHGDVVLNASYALRISKEGWRQVTSLNPVTPLARHFDSGDSKKPLDVFIGLEPTHINFRVRVEPADATITVQGLAVKSGPASLSVEDLKSRWVKHGDSLALPLKVEASKDGYVASVETIYARAMPHRADVNIKMRPAQICIRCVSTDGTLIEDAIDVVVENERHSLRFGGMDESVFGAWVATQKKVNRRDRSPALLALLEHEADVRSELFVDGKAASSARVLEVFSKYDGARLAAQAGRSGRGGVVVGASYNIRATHADYLSETMERRFDSNAFDTHGPLVVDVPLVPVYCDVILRVVDASSGKDITDGDASVHGVHLGARRTARLRLFEHSRDALDADVVVTHKTYAQVQSTYEQLRPGPVLTYTVRMRPCKILVTPTHGNEPVPLAKCSLVTEDKVLDASGPVLIELGVPYEVKVEHATLVRVGDSTVTFRKEQFLDEDLVQINVEMADRGASVAIEVVDETTGAAIDGQVKLSGVDVGSSVDDVTWRRCSPVRATCIHPSMSLVKATLRVERGDDITEDEVKASSEGALVPSYTPKADERASLVLKMRALQFRVQCTHASDPSFVFDDASLTIAPRDATICANLKVEKQANGWLVSQLPPCANGYSVWCAAGRAAQARAAIVTLDELLRAPRGEMVEIKVTMESIDGDINLNVSDGEGSDVALGAHRVGGWRGAIRLIGVSTGSLEVDSNADALVGECRVRAGSSQHVSLTRRRTVVDVVARCDGVVLEDVRCALIDQDGTMLDLPGAVVVSTQMGTRDGADIILDGGARLKVPNHLIQGDRRVKVPRKYYTLEVSRTGYRQTTMRDLPIAFAADQFVDGKHLLEVEMERCGAELSFDVVDSWGKPLGGVSLEVDGRPITDGRCGVETGVEEVRVVASKKGYVQLTPVATRMSGRDARVRVALGSYRLHAAVVDTDGKPVNNCDVDVYLNDQCMQRLGRFRRKAFVAPSLEKFAFRASREGWRQAEESVDARLLAQHSSRSQAFTSVKFGAAFSSNERTYSQRMYLADRNRLPENYPRQSPRETACRRLKCWDEMRAFFSWRLNTDLVPLPVNEGGRHGAVVLIVEKEPAPELTAPIEEEAPEKTARFHVVDVRTDNALPDAQLVVDGSRQAQGIVASSQNTVEVRCELEGYVQLGETTHSLDTGTHADMAAFALDSVELRMRPRDVLVKIVGDDNEPVEGVSVVLTPGDISVTHDAVLVLRGEAYALTCATPGWVCGSDTLEVSTEAFRASDEVLVKQIRVERARVAVDVEVVDVATGEMIPDVSVTIGGAAIEDGSLPYDATQGDRPIDVAFAEASWIVLRPETVNLEDNTTIKVECRRCSCIVSVVEQYTRTTLESARVTCDGDDYAAGQSFSIKPGSYPLSITLEGAETIQAYTLHASPEAFSSLEDGQPLILTVEMRATHSLLDLRVEDENETVLDDATVTLDGEAHTPGLVRKPFADGDEKTFSVHASRKGYAFAGPASFSVSRAKIGMTRQLVVRMRPARVRCTAVDENGTALDALVRLTPSEGPEVKDNVDVDTVYKVDCTLRKYHRSGIRCDHGTVSRSGDAFCIQFTDADFMRSSAPLEIEVTMEPARCVIDLAIVEETPTDCVLDTVLVDIGQRGFSRDRRWSASLSDLPERLAIDVKATKHVLVGPTFVTAVEGVVSQTLCLRPALVDAVVYDEEHSVVEGCDVWLKPLHDVHASTLIVLEAGAPQTCVVELGREYAVTCRKERLNCKCATFKATAEQLRALAPGSCLRLEIEARRTQYKSVDVQVRGLYDVGSGQDDPATLASVKINDEDLGPSRGSRDVAAADNTLSTSCRLRGWAQLPPYAVPTIDGTTPIKLEMVPALVRAVPSVDVEVECWLETEGDTIQVPTTGWTRVQVDVTYVLRARAPGMRLASSKTVTFTREQFWEASRTMEAPPSATNPVVVSLDLVLEPSTCELALDVNNDDCSLTLEREGLPDLSLIRGSQVVEGLPASRVSSTLRASLKGHAQLKPLGPITLAAAQKHAVSIEMRPATVLCKCIDARTGAELVHARVRYEGGGDVRYGGRRSPVVVDPAHYRGCIIEERVGDAYRILRDDGSTMVVDADRLRGSSPEWTALEQGPPPTYVYEVNQHVWNGKRHGTIASIKDTTYRVAFEDGAADVDVSRIRPVNYDFRRHLPSGLRCEVRTGGSYQITAELKGWRQLDYTSPHVFENSAFVALGGPVKPDVVEWDASVSVSLSTSSKSLWMRFLKPDLGRALRTWHHGAEATREARAQEGKLIAPPLKLAMRLVPGVGSVDLSVTCDGQDVDADISLIPVVDSKADPPIMLGERRGIINNLEVAGAGEPALYKVRAKKFGYRVREPSTVSLRAGACTSVSVQLARCLANVNLNVSGKPFAGDAIVRVVSNEVVLASVAARDGTCSIPVDPRVACKLVVEADRHEQISALKNATWAPSDFEKGVTVDIALRAIAVTLDVSVVDAASRKELPAADVRVGGLDVGTRRGLVDFDDLSQTGLVRMAASLQGYHMLPPYNVELVGGAVVTVALRLRRFEVVLSAAKRKSGELIKLASAEVALYHNGEKVMNKDGVYGIEPNQSYAIIARAEGHRQASLTDSIIFSPQHFDDGLSDRLELTVELESELFEALVRVVDDETGAPLDGAILQLDGFETCGPSATGWRRVGKKLAEVAGPAVFLPCVAAAPRRVQTSTARIELRNDGVVPCTTLRLRRASIAVRVLDDEGRAVQDPVVQVGLSSKAPSDEVSTPRVGTMALDRRRPAPQYVRPRNEVLVVLDHFYDVRVVHESMRQSDLLDPQRFEVMDFGRRSGDAALSIRMEPYRCAVDLKVVDAFGDDLPRARVRLGNHDLGTRRGVLDLGPNGAVAAPEEE